MKEITLKVFVIPSLYVTDIKEYISINHSKFPIINLEFEYSMKLKLFRLIVNMESVRFSDFIISLRSEWFSPSRFSDEHSNLKHFISHIDELAF